MSTISRRPLEADVEAFFSLRPDLMQDRFPIYRRMREEAPVFVFGNVASITRYSYVEGVIRNMTDYSSRRGGGSRTAAAMERLDERGRRLLRDEMDFEDLRLTALDPPAHTRMRGFAHRAFTPRRVAELRPTIESILRQLLDEASPKDTVDLIDDVAYKMPLYVIGGMLGVGDGDRHLIRHWSSVRAAFMGTDYSNLEEQSRGTAQFRAYIRSLVAERRTSPHTDLLAALLEPDANGDRLEPHELEAIFALLLFAGHETTTNLIANSVHGLLTHPDQMQGSAGRSRPGAERCRGVPALVEPVPARPSQGSPHDGDRRREHPHGHGSAPVPGRRQP
jgi:cytochrome P450